jgi:GH25 family lysozyme M1 (1,4-beta-N-acetylmuramidase)
MSAGWPYRRIYLRASQRPRLGASASREHPLDSAGQLNDPTGHTNPTGTTTGETGPRQPCPGAAGPAVRAGLRSGRATAIGYGHPQPPERGEQLTIHYPDISHHQSGLAIQAGTPAVCAKASEGTTFRDPSFATFRTQAGTRGVFFFGYHWLHRGNADAQAAFCHSVAGGTPIMIDCEDTGDSPTVADCLAFAAGLRSRGGRCTLAYLPHWYWQDYLHGASLTALRGAGLGLVSSNYTSYSDSGPGWTPYGGVTPVIWQYTDAHSYGGQSVDFNAYRGTTAQLQALVSGSITSREEPEVPHLDLELNVPKIMTSPTVVGGAAWVCLSSDFGDAQVRVALKRSGSGWDIHDNVTVTAAKDHVVVAKITSSTTKISAVLASSTTANTVVALDVYPDHQF